MTEDDYKRLRVLVVDDHPVNLKVAVTMLQRIGCQVEGVLSGGEALDHLRDHAVDIVFMDCNMPGLDGYATTRAIRAVSPPAGQPLIVAVTTNNLPGDREACLACGMDDYLAKPVGLQDFRTLLANHEQRLPQLS